MGRSTRSLIAGRRGPPARSGNRRSAGLVGIENWDDPDWNYASGKRLWNVYGWTGEAFTFNPKLGTAQEVALDARTNEYIQRVMSNLNSKH